MTAEAVCDPTTTLTARTPRYAIELWWVPNDVLVEKVPDPDPIVVGVVLVPKGNNFYFELHRWIDESVETAWWTREGY